MICPECRFKNPPEALTCGKCQEKLYHAKLRVTIDERESQTHYLFPRRYTIGRDTDNDIVISDVSVSRNHAEIDYQNGSFIIHDKDSKNGSHLNDCLFKARRLRDLDCIQLGNVVIHFYHEGNSCLDSHPGRDTTERVQREFFRYTKNGHPNITIDDLLLTMLDLAISLIHADEALILQFDATRRLRFKTGKKPKGLPVIDNHLSDFDWNIIHQAIRKQETETVYKPVRPESSQAPTPEPVCWHKMAIPLVSANAADQQKNRLGRVGTLGVLFVVQEARSKEISKRKSELLSTIVQQITFALENEMLYAQALEKRRIDKELSLAKEIQAKLLPISNPNIDRFEFASFVHPCEAVSGDYFDFFQISSNSIGIAIGDICGKGVPAALLTSTVQAAIHSQLAYTRSVGQIVRNLNRLLIRNTAESIFLTLFFGIIDVDTGQFKYINAGHPPPIFITKGLAITELGGTTPALGVFEGKFESERTINFAPGDMLFMYTDGIIESQNQEKKIYGRKRLLKHIQSLFLGEPKQIYELESVIKYITDDIMEFIDGAKQVDDLTLLAVKRL